MTQAGSPELSRSPRPPEAGALDQVWKTAPRWKGVTRSYPADKVLRLRGTMKIQHTVADQMARKLWALLQTEQYVPALGAVTGNQAVQMAQAGLKAIYLSGWQVAADNNLGSTMYPDQSLLEKDLALHSSGDDVLGLFNYKLDPFLKEDIQDADPQARDKLSDELKAFIQTYNHALIHNRMVLPPAISARDLKTK